MRVKLYAIIALLIIFSITPTAALGQWVEISPANAANVTFFGIDFFDTQNGIAVGRDIVSREGVIARTNNGGVSWSFERTPNAEFRAVGYFNGSEAIVCGYDGPPGTRALYWRSVDGGNSWIRTNTPLVTGIYELDIINGREAAILGFGPAFGLTFFIGSLLEKGTVIGPVEDDLQGALAGINFIDNSIGFVGSTDLQQSWLLTTTDRGGNWIPRALPGGILRHISFIDAQTGLALTDDNVYRTGDAGRSWSAASLNEEFHVALLLPNGSDGFLAAESGAIARTNDGGSSWQVEDRRSNGIWYIIHRGAYVYACGEGGTVLRRSADIAASVADGAANGALYGLDVLGNPLIGSSKLDCANNGLTAVRLELEIRDILGKPIVELYNGSLTPGVQRFDIGELDLPAGLYFVVGRFGESVIHAVPAIVGE